MPHKHLVAVQVQSNNAPELMLSARDRSKIVADFGDDLQVTWLPQIARPRREDASHLETIILIFVLGTAFASIVKPFLESPAKEAGKDFWNLIKGLVSGIWKRQADRAYKLRSRAIVIFELGDEFVGIRFMFHTTPAESLGEYEKLFEQQAKELAEYCDEIQSTIDKFSVGDFGPEKVAPFISKGTRLHIIHKAGAKWTISPDEMSELSDLKMGWGPL